LKNQYSKHLLIIIKIYSHKSAGATCAVETDNDRRTEKKLRNSIIHGQQAADVN